MQDRDIRVKIQWIKSTIQNLVVRICNLEKKTVRVLPENVFLALINSNNPSENNPFVTMSDLVILNTPVLVNTYSDLPPANTVTGKFYYVISSQGTWWLPGSLGGNWYPRGLYYSDGAAWLTTPIPWQAEQVDVGTEVADGGTVNDQFVTPKTLKYKGYSLMQRTAGENIPAHRAVVIINNLLYLFDPNDANHYAKCVGISYTAGNAGGNIEVVTDDEITLGYPLTNGALYYGGPSGTLVTTSPNNGIVQIIGMATTTNKFFVDIKIPIKKAI